MNPHQLAREHCDCYENGQCLGITVDDKCSPVRFRPENSRCLLIAPVQRCRHFEQCVLPMEKREEWAKDARKSAAIASEFKEGAHEYRIRTGFLTSPIRLCPQCRKSKIGEGRKLCDDCKAKNRRETFSKSNQSRK